MPGAIFTDPEIGTAGLTADEAKAKGIEVLWDDRDERPGVQRAQDRQALRLLGGVAAVGFSTLNLLQGYIQDFSGANATMQGQPAMRGKGRSQNTHRKFGERREARRTPAMLE